MPSRRPAARAERDSGVYPALITRSRPGSRADRGRGVDGLETRLALHALASDLLDITVLAPELKFINLSISVDQPFKPQPVRGLRLQEAAAELGARRHQAALDRVEPERSRVITRDGDEVRYDTLVLALGTHPEREWHSREVLTYHGGRDGPNYRLLLHQLLEERVNKLAFVKPAGPSWPLPCTTSRCSPRPTAPRTTGQASNSA